MSDLRIIHRRYVILLYLSFYKIKIKKHLGDPPYQISENQTLMFLFLSIETKKKSTNQMLSPNKAAMNQC